MKRKIISILSAFVLLLFSVIFLNSKPEINPDFIANYMETIKSINMLQTEDFIAINDSMQQLYFYDKNTEKTSVLGENVFDTNSMRYFLTGKNGKNSFYCVKTKQRGAGTVICSVDMETLKSEKIRASVAVTNYSASLGMGEYLGIATPVSEVSYIVTNRGIYYLFDDEFLGRKDVINKLYEYDKDGEYSVDTTCVKIASKGNKIYIINTLNDLIAFDSSTKEFLRCENFKAEDFFVSTRGVFASDMTGKWYRLSDDFNEIEKIDAEDIKEIKTLGERIFVKDSENKIYELQNNELRFLIQNDSVSWCCDGEYLYTCKDGHEITKTAVDENS